MKNFKSNKILLVDKDESALESMSIYLAELGYEVFTARSCITGLEMVKNLKPDVVVSETGMSGLSGIEFAIVIRGLNYHVPVILVSSCDKKALAGIDKCSYGFLQKPINILEFKKMINNALTNGRMECKELVSC
ncbi:MAG: response regulator [Ignavibacteria bacterium]|nr:response regulator [Ignavibacteria bacterium]